MAVPLVTNGDGNHAAGLAVLVSALHDLGVVHVLAPETRRRRSTARRRIASTSACSACCPDAVTERAKNRTVTGVHEGFPYQSLRVFPWLTDGPPAPKWECWKRLR